MSARKRDYAAEYAARRARAKAGGWTGYGQRRYRLERLDDAEVRRLAEQIGGPVEPERAGSLMSLEANRIVNPRDRDRLPADWRLRLLQAAGQM